MKTLLPNQKSPLRTLSDKPFNISEEMWNRLIQDVSSLQVQLENDELSLEDYKRAIAESFTTVALTSNTANIGEADITNLVTSVIQNSDFHGSHIEANDIDVITAMIQDSLKAGSVEAGSIKANTGAQVETLVVNDNARVGGNLQVGGTIDVDHVTVHSYNADTLNVSQAEITEENVAKSNVSEAVINEADIETADIDVGTIRDAHIAQIDNTKLNTDYITHNARYLAQVDADNFYIKLPYFQNGQYYIYITDAANNDFVGCIEDFNSSNNHFFRWSFKDANVFNNIYLNGYNTHQSQSAYYLSTNGKRYNIFYQCQSFDTTEPPATSDVLGFTPDKRFNVTEVNGNWFTMPVALYNEGEGGGVLTLTASDVLMYADDIKSYNGTSNVHNTVYKPNQSLNKTDDVTFNSVEAPFLDVAELSIVNKAKLPNVYNGPALSAEEQEDLMDDTLYIPQSGNTTGTTVPGFAFVSNDEPLNYWASSVKKAIDQETFRTDEYKPTDGYILPDFSLDDAKPCDISTICSSTEQADTTCLVQNLTTGEYFYAVRILNNQQMKVFYGFIKAHDWEYDNGPKATSGIRWKAMAYPLYTNSSMSDVIDMNSLAASDEFYILSPDVYVPTGEYRVRYVNCTIVGNDGLTYLKEGSGTSATINRKTTRDNAPAIDEFIPINNALFDSTTQEQQVGQVVTDEYPDETYVKYIDETVLSGEVPATYDSSYDLADITLDTIDGETPTQYYHNTTDGWRYVHFDDEGEIVEDSVVEDAATLDILNGQSGTVVDVANALIIGKGSINNASNNATRYLEYSNGYKPYEYSTLTEETRSAKINSGDFDCYATIDANGDFTELTNFGSATEYDHRNALKIEGQSLKNGAMSGATEGLYLVANTSAIVLPYLLYKLGSNFYKITGANTSTYEVTKELLTNSTTPTITQATNWWNGSDGTKLQATLAMANLVHEGTSGSTTSHTWKKVTYTYTVTEQTGTVPADYDRTEVDTHTSGEHTITTVTYYKEVVVGGYQPGNPLAYDPVTKTLIPANNAPAIVLGDNYRFEVVEQPSGSLHTHLLMRRETIDGQHKYNELATFNSDKTFDETTPLVYDADDNSLKPATDITVNGNGHFNGSVNIDGDLTVDGKITAVSEEIVQSKADYITLRQNNPNGLANGEHSGIIINNVDGEGKNTALVVDNDGMLRVGSAVGTETTYNEIYYKKADNKWYSDSTLETEVTVTGILTSWATSSETEDYIVYTDAVFTDIDASHNEPILTRSEAEDLSDGAPLYWNEERKRAENTPATSGQQVWMSSYTPGHSAYDKNVVKTFISSSYGYAIENSDTHEKTTFDLDGNEVSVEDYTTVPLELMATSDLPEGGDLYFNTTDNKLYWHSTNEPINWSVQTSTVFFDESTNTVKMSFMSAESHPDPADIYPCTATGIKYSSFYGYYDPTDMSETTYPSDVPSDAVITDSTAVNVLYSEDDGAFFDADNQHKIIAIDSEGNITTDDTVTPTSTPVDAQLIYRNIHADGTEAKMSYGWQQSSQGSFFVFNTFAEYQAALTIPPGQPGHIPTPEEGNAIVVVKEGKSYLYGEVNNE